MAGALLVALALAGVLGLALALALVFAPPAAAFLGAALVALLPAFFALGAAALEAVALDVAFSALGALGALVFLAARGMAMFPYGKGNSTNTNGSSGGTAKGAPIPRAEKLPDYS